MKTAIYCKEVLEYISLCDSGIVLLSDENMLLLQNEVKPLLKRSDIIFDSNTYYKFLDFADKFYYPLFPYQKFLAFFHFLYFDDDSLVYNEYFYYMGRGNGKDGFIGPLVNFFQTEYFGVRQYHVDIVANSEEQSEATFKVVYSMMKNPKFFKVGYLTLLIIYIILCAKGRLAINYSYISLILC